MIVYKHKNYEDYLVAQVQRSKRRTNYGRRLVSWISEEDLLKVNRLIHIYKNDIKTVVCHGCRNGLEVEVLQKLNPSAKVFGTDIYGKSYQYDRAYFKEMDFDTVPEEWRGYFDVIYSNSIDHSRDLINTLLAWEMELKKNGICFVVFNYGGEVNQADCSHLDGVDYKLETNEIGEKVNMKVSYISDPYKDPYGNICANVVLSRQ